MVDKTAIGLDTRFLSLLCEQGSRENLWTTFLRHVSARRVAEIGVWKGEFASYLLHNCSDIEQYYMIDPWRNLENWNKPYNVSQGDFDQVYKAAMENTQQYSAKRVVLADETKRAAAKIAENSLEFAYIDGDHTLRGIVIDLLCMLSRVAQGGYIGGDDFAAHPWQHGPQYEPTLVCPFAVYFAEAIDLPIIALPHNQFLIYKHPDPGFSFTDYTGRYADISLKSGKTAGTRRSLLKRIGFFRKHYAFWSKPAKSQSSK